MLIFDTWNGRIWKNLVPGFVILITLQFSPFLCLEEQVFFPSLLPKKRREAQLIASLYT